MNTRRTLDLSTKTFTDLQLSSTRMTHLPTLSKSHSDSSLSSQTKPKNELTTIDSIPSDTFQQQKISTDEIDDFRELEQVQQRQIELEEKILGRIPCYKSSSGIDINVFLDQAEFIFNKLKYSDEIRLEKITDKLDYTLQKCLNKSKQNHPYTWQHCRLELMQWSKARFTFENPLIYKKLNDFDEHKQNVLEDNTSLINLIRRDMKPFSGEENGHQWLKQLDKTFFQLKISFNERIEILPHLFYGDAMLWFSLNQEKFHRYTDFCQLFFLEFSGRQSLIPEVIGNEQENKTPSLQSPILIRKNSINPISLNVMDKQASTDCQILSSPHANNSYSSNSIVSSSISRALIDKFVKDPIKFSGSKDNVIIWLEEIDQQFKLMNLSDPDKLNLIHICLRSEAYNWYRHNKSKFTSWTMFVNEISDSFTSHLQRDSSFKKLKQYHQTVDQSVLQYYTEMMKLIRQVDGQMNESTKVQYLMNGLLPSLVTETRRSYPKTAEEFLKQAKTAEELVSLNNTVILPSMYDDERSISPSFQCRTQTMFGPNKVRSDHFRQSPADQQYQRFDQNTNNEFNNRRFVNQIPGSFDRQINRQNQSIRSFQPSSNVHSSKTYASYNNNNNNNNSHRFENINQQQQQNRNKCYKCGSPDHSSRQCNPFEQRSQ